MCWRSPWEACGPRAEGVGELVETHLLSVKDLEAFGGRWDSLQVLEQKITLI